MPSALILSKQNTNLFQSVTKRRYSSIKNTWLTYDGVDVGLLALALGWVAGLHTVGFNWDLVFIWTLFIDLSLLLGGSILWICLGEGDVRFGIATHATALHAASVVLGWLLLLHLDHHLTVLMLNWWLLSHRRRLTNSVGIFDNFDTIRSGGHNVTLLVKPVIFRRFPDLISVLIISLLIENLLWWGQVTLASPSIRLYPSDKTYLAVAVYLPVSLPLVIRIASNVRIIIKDQCFSLILYIFNTIIAILYPGIVEHFGRTSDCEEFVVAGGGDRARREKFQFRAACHLLLLHFWFD